jgi:hypothetical protein
VGQASYNPFWLKRGTPHEIKTLLIHVMLGYYSLIRFLLEHLPPDNQMYGLINMVLITHKNTLKCLCRAPNITGISTLQQRRKQFMELQRQRLVAQQRVDTVQFRLVDSIKQKWELIESLIQQQTALLTQASNTKKNTLEQTMWLYAYRSEVAREYIIMVRRLLHLLPVPADV